MKKLKVFVLMMLIIISCTAGYYKKSDNSLPEGKDTASVVNIKPAGFVSVARPENPLRTITVGGNKADIPGFTSQAIQVAIDALHQAGGGTVRILPGNYEVIAPVKLFSNIELIGSGTASVLKKSNGVRTHFIMDAGYGELQLTVEDASGFTPGMGIQVYDSESTDGWDITTAVITSIKGNVIHIDNYLIRDYLADKQGTISNSCSVISAVEAENVKISNLVVDGNGKSNDALNGCRGGGIYLHKVKDALIENLIVRDCSEDGISWQITENVTVRNCEIFGCSNAGMHPGTGAPFSIIEGNNSHDNGRFGIFVCWRVRNGIVRNNVFSHNDQFGICTGHMDTDMLFEKNVISENGYDGVHFRTETQSNAPHRNVFRNNVVENNGWKDGGYGFSFNSPAGEVILEDNIIRNTKGAPQKAAVCIDENGLPVILKNNTMSGHPKGEVVKEKNTNGI